MNKIQLMAGYHEWNVFINDECIFTFDDISESISDGNLIEDIIEDCISIIGLDVILNENELNELRKQMKQKWEKHYILQY